MRAIVCPKCFTSHVQTDLLYVCTRNGCSKADVPVEISLEQQKKGNVLCVECGEHMITRVCPECSYTIQAGDDEIETLPVSIIGSEGSGKSNYLSVLIYQIRQYMSKGYHCALYPVGGDDTINQYENRYYKPLFVSGQCLSNTDQDEILPLIYSLVFSGRRQLGSTCNLTFYDACGANFENERMMADYNRSIYNSRGILLFLDPTQLPALKEQSNARGWKTCKGDINALLSRTIHLIRQGSNQKNVRKKISIPIAVCLTKIDLLRPLLDPSSFLRYPSRHLDRPAFDVIDYASLSAEVRSLIESWGGGELVHQVSTQFAHFGFFGVSSLGNMPDATNRIQRVAPHRVLDPFLWILGKNKIVRVNGMKD